MSAETTYTLIAKTFAGLEPVLEAELKALGANSMVPITRGVRFRGTLETLYKANLQCRTALRILRAIHSFRASNPDELYESIRNFNWDQVLSVRETFAVDAVVNSPQFRHSKYAALKVKDAIVDQFRDRTGRRPSVDVERPHLRLHLHIDGDECSVSLDSSGASLHLRGYRTAQGPAPLSEVLAAGMVLLTGWDGTGNFVDPMCGSGTILTEAALIAGNIAPGKYRKGFGFERWQDFDARLWKQVREEVYGSERKLECSLFGADKSPLAISMTERNAESAGIGRHLQVEKAAFSKYTPPEGGGTMIMNPPYGERLELEDQRAFYKMIGDRLKQAWTGYTAWMISSNASGMKAVGLRADHKHSLYNGPLPCRFNGYNIFEGKRVIQE